MEFVIAEGLSLFSKKWTNVNYTWSSFVERLYNPVITNETQKQYSIASKEEKVRIKDVGGFVGGQIVGKQRLLSNVSHRQLICLDLDNCYEAFWDEFTDAYDFAAVIHSTHASNKNNFRVRLIIPLSEPVDKDRYEAISRKIGSKFGDAVDASTYQFNRLMFWPSISSDAEYYFKEQLGEILNPADILDQYENWRDVSSWHKSNDYVSDLLEKTKVQENPLTKKGLVGAFCKTYTISEAIDEFLSDIYTKVSDTRYTFVNGSTVGGLLVYDDLLCFSHHGSDPISGRCCNSFDLVRIHKFGAKDEGVKIDESKPNRIPSFIEMEELVSLDKKTKIRLAEERFQNAKKDFGEELPDDGYDSSWTHELEINTKGEYLSKANNISLIFKKDSILKDAFKLNLFDSRKYLCKSMPWRKIKREEPMRDVDHSGVRNYIESVYGIFAVGKVDDALALEVEKNCFHPIVDYISSLKWDGVERVDTLLIDFFGVKDDLYTRAAIRKTLVGAVARVFNPGVKFDLVLTLVGDQGVGKSSFARILGRSWFSDTFITVQGKEAFEQLQGSWLIEMAELSGLKKAEIENIRQFISKSEDRFRFAYGKEIQTYPRQCVFIGTTNTKDFLRDPTGERRFMPIDTNKTMITKSVFTDLEPIVDQIWAEAKHLYDNKEPLFFNREESALATTEQREHAETDNRKGIVADYLDTLLPETWKYMDLLERRQWMRDRDMAAKGIDQRQHVCVAEIWCECLGKEKEEMSRYNTREINEIMRGLFSWELAASTKRFPIYGVQKYYERVSHESA